MVKTKNVLFETYLEKFKLIVIQHKSRTQNHRFSTVNTWTHHAVEHQRGFLPTNPGMGWLIYPTWPPPSFRLPFNG